MKQILENIVILVVFGLALGYLINTIFKSFNGKKSCSSNCGGACGVKLPEPITLNE